MPQVAIPHVIGTVMLIVLLGIVILYAQNIEVNNTLETASIQLKDVAEYVSSEVISLIDIASLRHNSTYLYKVIKVPMDINGMGYNIELVEESGKWIVIASLDKYPSVEGKSYLYFSSGINVINISGSITLENGWVIYSLPKLYSGVSNISPESSSKIVFAVVWCRVDGDIITVGLGRLEVS